MHSQPWAHLVPSAVLTGKKTWHQDHLRKEATHSATGMLALKGFLAWSCPNTTHMGTGSQNHHRAHEPRLSLKDLGLLCLTFHNLFSFLQGLNQTQGSAFPPQTRSLTRHHSPEMAEQE